MEFDDTDDEGDGVMVRVSEGVRIRASGRRKDTLRNLSKGEPCAYPQLIGFPRFEKEVT